jgi:hypothetical protein
MASYLFKSSSVDKLALIAFVMESREFNLKENNFSRFIFA